MTLGPDSMVDPKGFTTLWCRDSTRVRSPPLIVSRVIVVVPVEPFPESVGRSGKGVERNYTWWL